MNVDYSGSVLEANTYEHVHICWFYVICHRIDKSILEAEQEVSNECGVINFIVSLEFEI